MCLATVYTESTGDDSKTMLLDKVEFIDVYGDELTCTNLFGEVVRVRGAITSVDLSSSTVMLKVD